MRGLIVVLFNVTAAMRASKLPSTVEPPLSVIDWSAMTLPTKGSACTESRRAADLPKDVASLSAVGEHNPTVAERSQCGSHLEDEDGIGSPPPSRIRVPPATISKVVDAES